MSIDVFLNTNLWKVRVTFRVMEVGCYVTVNDGGNYVTFHELNVRKKIKTIAKSAVGQCE